MLLQQSLSTEVPYVQLWPYNSAYHHRKFIHLSFAVLWPAFVKHATEQKLTEMQLVNVSKIALRNLLACLDCSVPIGSPQCSLQSPPFFCFNS